MSHDLIVWSEDGMSGSDGYWQVRIYEGAVKPRARPHWVLQFTSGLGSVDISGCLKGDVELAHNAAQARLYLMRKEGRT